MAESINEYDYDIQKALEIALTYSNEIEKFQEILNKNNDVILLLGTTGAGKTTLLNKLFNTDFTTSPELNSQTLLPNYYKYNNFLWIDMPGLGHNNTLSEDFVIELLWEVIMSSNIRIIKIIHLISAGQLSNRESFHPENIFGIYLYEQNYYDEILNYIITKGDLDKSLIKRYIKNDRSDARIVEFLRSICKRMISEKDIKNNIDTLINDKFMGPSGIFTSTLSSTNKNILTKHVLNLFEEWHTKYNRIKSIESVLERLNLEIKHKEKMLDVFELQMKNNHHDALTGVKSLIEECNINIVKTQKDLENKYEMQPLLKDNYNEMKNKMNKYNGERLVLLERRKIVFMFMTTVSANGYIQKIEVVPKVRIKYNKSSKVYELTKANLDLTRQYELFFYSYYRDTIDGKKELESLNRDYYERKIKYDTCKGNIKHYKVILDKYEHEKNELLSKLKSIETASELDIMKIQSEMQEISYQIFELKGQIIENKNILSRHVEELKEEIKIRGKLLDLTFFKQMLCDSHRETIELVNNNNILKENC